MVSVPGSKSISNRALVCAGLASGESMIRGLASGDDTHKMLEGLRSMGARVTPESVSDIEDSVRVERGIRRDEATSVVINAGLAGTTSRFLTAVAALRLGPTTITGGQGLLTRPMGELHRALGELGADLYTDEPGHLPVTVRGVVIDRQSRSATQQIIMRGEVSSQFVSAVMLIAPVIGGLRIVLEGPLVSSDYLNMTARVMRAFGADVSLENGRVVIGAASYVGATFDVAADWSSASYPFAAAAIVGGRVSVPRLVADGSQPEERFAEVLRATGCVVESNVSGVTVSRESSSPLKGIEIDMSECSDLVPTFAAIAANASGPSRVTGVGFIRAKESDRLGDLAVELAKCGVRADVEIDGIRIEPGPLRAAVIEPHDDHRLAMSLALLGLRCDGVQVQNPDVVAKSWPTYWASMRSGLSLT